MKKFSAFTLSMLLCACLGCAKKETVAITIGNIPITVDEFNDAFEEGRFQYGVELSRKDFLDSYIIRKLILKEAEDLKLDTDPQVLKSLQVFWEQTLLRLALTRKINEMTVPLEVSDNDILEFYEAQKNRDYIGKELPDVREDIKLIIFRRKQQQALQEWTDELKKRKKVAIDYRLLGIQ